MPHCTVAIIENLPDVDLNLSPYTDLSQRIATLRTLTHFTIPIAATDVLLRGLVKLDCLQALGIRYTLT